MSTDSHDTIVNQPAAHHTSTPEPATVILALRDRTVSFTGRKVSSFPDLGGQLDPTCGLVDTEVVYLTGQGRVAIHRTRRRTLAVYDLDDFVTTFIESPVSWIVDDVLAAFPRPIETLDI